MTPIVQLRDVSKSYATATGTTSVLRGLDLTIEAGEKASLVGPSGSGKSTLLSLIAGLLRPDDGSVEIDGHRVSELDDTARARLRAQRIGIALQADNLIPFLNARENIELALAFGGQGRNGRRDAETAATDLLDRFGLADRARHLPRHLSGGEAQRVALAVSMANEPDLLLADEVVAQLDGGTAGRVIDDVLAAPCAVLFVTHVVALADQTETRYELRDGAVHRR
ncbi:MAG: ABC transporter ATP-binding protein [Candidatus Limnocylindrales bacterium]